MNSPAGLRLAVVTGASAGIGQELARAIAMGGRPVLAVARRRERLLELSTEAAEKSWAPIHVLALDLAEKGAAALVLARALDLGGAEWLVNNAGVGGYGRVSEADPEKLAAMIRLNCESLVLLTRTFLPRLIEDGGFVLNVASVAAFQPLPFHAVYGATKSFVLSFTEGLAEELRGSRAGAGAFCPGPVTTEFQEVAGLKGRGFSLPALTAQAAARLALLQLRRREVIRLTGLADRLATGAARMLPRGLVRRAAARVNRPGSAGRADREKGGAR
ncbi:MAG TPA: SDR family NAD(P)-dependent oxidoreductase [Anaeromyxobacter sp.]|nr:SDR family NAD(P)-dependent oxidoreductase [Anaeromyxobacter sp.]